VTTESVRSRSFHTAVLVRGHIGQPIHLTGPEEWIDSILAAFAGNLIALELSPRNAPPMRAISVYSPSWKIPPDYTRGVDLSVLKPTQNRGLWLTDLLLASLEHCRPNPRDLWVIAGDLNLSESFDAESWSAGGNKAYLDRMAALGLTECLRKAKGALTPTFKSPRGGWVSHQIDHLFVSEGLASRLVACETGSQERVFDPSLSDHLPIVATFGF